MMPLSTPLSGSQAYPRRATRAATIRPMLLATTALCRPLLPF